MQLPLADKNNYYVVAKYIVDPVTDKWDRAAKCVRAKKRCEHPGCVRPSQSVGTSLNYPYILAVCDDCKDRCNY